jgi:predicted nucleotidyltransferase
VKTGARHRPASSNREAARADPDQPFAEERLDALSALARRYGWRLVVLFGSSAQGEGRDVDLAVLPAYAAEGLEVGAWQAALEALFAPRPVDMVLIHPGMSPLLRYEALCRGRCLYEAEEGLFDAEQDRAFFLHADSAPLRRALHVFLREA